MLAKPCQFILFAAALAITLDAGADPFDGSRPLLCATLDTIECTAVSGCAHDTAESMGFPRFLNVDIDKQRIDAVRQDGSELHAPITSVTQLDDRWVLQGIENRLGWTAAITRATGRMSVAIAGDQISFVVFSACTVR